MELSVCDVRPLTDAELDQVSGGVIWGLVVLAFAGGMLAGAAVAE